MCAAVLGDQHRGGRPGAVRRMRRGTWTPVTRSTASRNSRTEKPRPVSRLTVEAVAAAEQVTDGGHVGIREIGDAEVVAYGGSVRGRVVVAEDGDLVHAPQGGEDCSRDEMGFWIVTLTNLGVTGSPPQALKHRMRTERRP